MKPRAAALFVAVALVAAFAVYRLAGEDRDDPFDVEPRTGVPESEAGALFPLGDALFRQRVEGNAGVVVDAYRRALVEAAAIRDRTRMEASGWSREPWSPGGRTDAGGRVVDLAPDPARPDSLYAATASGGIWKSSDAGQIWARSWPEDLTHTMGAVAVTADGTVYAGTGEPRPHGGFLLWGGAGVYRSGDGGATWDHVGLGDSGAVGRIAPDPADPSRVYVAAAGGPLLPGGDRGVFRTTDAGATWEPVLPSANRTTGAVDVAVHPSGRVLAATWDRDVLDGRLAGPGSAVHLSRDGGDTWNRVSLPGNVPQGRVGRIGVAFAPSAPDRAYAVVANDEGGEVVGVWRSDDGGLSWSRTGVAGGDLGRVSGGALYGEIWVDPGDPDRVLLSGAALLESVDGGDSFRVNVAGGGLGAAGDVAEGIQPGHHAMAWDPGQAGLVYLGGAGGVSRSPANGRRGSWVTAVRQGWTDAYSVETRSLDGAPPGFSPTVAGTQPVAVEFDPSDPDVAYFGGTTLNRTEDGGRTWTAVSPDLTVARRADRVGVAVITAVAAAASDPRVIHAGTSNGLLWRTEDLGGRWKPLRSDGGTGRWVTRIAVDPRDADVAHVAFSGYGSDPRLLRSTDGGRTWSDIGAGLPPSPVNDVVVLARRRLAVATDVGVLLTEDLGRSWVTPGADLPAIPVLDLRYDRKEGLLFAATFGVGVQRLPLR